MTGRIATSQTYQSTLAGIYAAQAAQQKASTQASSGHKAADLKGYAQQADAITAGQTVSSRLGAYVDAATSLSDRLSVQDKALSNVSTAAQSAYATVLSAAGTGSGTALLDTLQSYYSQTVDALNTNYQGQYVFSGGKPGTAPVTTATLTDLTAPATVASVFTNGDQKQVSRIDDNVTVQTGIVASDVGTPLLTALKSIADYAQTNGPFGTSLTSAQITFLKGLLPSFAAAQTNADMYTAQNGVVQQQVTTAQSQLGDRKSAADNLVSNLTGADTAKAASDLQLATTALNVSAQVFSVLKSSSLISILGATG